MGPAKGLYCFVGVAVALHLTGGRKGGRRREREEGALFPAISPAKGLYCFVGMAMALHLTGGREGGRERWEGVLFPAILPTMFASWTWPWRCISLEGGREEREEGALFPALIVSWVWPWRCISLGERGLLPFYFRQARDFTVSW